MSQVPPELEAKIRDQIAKRQKLRAATGTLRQWADDARTSPAVTSGNVVQQVQTIKDRLGIFFDHFADFIDATEQ